MEESDRESDAPPPLEESGRESDGEEAGDGPASGELETSSDSDAEAFVNLLRDLHQESWRRQRQR